MIYAAIDIGSNAIRLLIAEVQNESSSGRYSGVKKRLLVRVPLRLGASVFKKGVISKENQEYLVKAMRSFRDIMELHGVTLYKACATSAMREASNSDEVIAMIAERCKINIELITGSEEAQIIRSTFNAQHFDSKTNYLYCDVGGGSTEVSLLINGECVNSESFKIGTVRMLQKKVKRDEWQRLGEWVKDNCRMKNIVGLGTGGNITKMMKLAGDESTKMLTYAQMVDLLDQLTPMSMEERMTEYALKIDRADVIVPAAKIYKRVLSKAKVKDIFVPKIGLSDGIVYGLHEGELFGFPCEFQSVLD